MISVLIIGGSRFVGRLVTQQLLTYDNIELTLFNRGISNPQKIKGVNYIYGDKETKDINQVFKRPWDVVIDMMGYYPNTIKDFVRKIDTKRYIFISTISVYDLKNPFQPLVNEVGKLLPKCTNEERNDKSWVTYGNRKISCEAEVLDTNLDAIILRPSLIYGPYDPLDRTYYWWYRIKKEKPYILPKSLEYPINFTYSVDMANIIVQAVFKQKHNRIYNVMTHPTMPFYHFMEKAASILKVKNNMQIIEDILLIDEGLIEDNIPLWFRDECLVFDFRKLENDFKPSFTPINKSIKDTIDWFAQRNWISPKLGLSIEAEEKYLNKFN